MTRMIVAIALAVVFVVAAVARNRSAGKTKAAAKTPQTESGRGTFKTAKERKSYVMGLDIAASLRRTGYESADIEVSSLFQGFSDAIRGPSAVVYRGDPRDDGDAADELVSAAERDVKAEAEKNKTEAKDFLTTNAKKRASRPPRAGCNTKCLWRATARRRRPPTWCKTHYHGTFINGRVFDSSVERGEPAGVSGQSSLISGWTEALQMMKVGSKWQLFVPSELAYGEEGTRR